MGGKSRKSGGVSKALIAKIQAGKTGTSKKNCGTKKKHNGKSQKSLFDEDERIEDNS